MSTIGTIVRNCRDCGKTFSLTQEQQEKFREKKFDLPARCEGYRAKKRHVEDMPCMDCGVPFPMTELDIEYYEKMGWKQPRRCPECRQKRREQKVK